MQNLEATNSIVGRELNYRDQSNENLDHEECNAATSSLPVQNVDQPIRRWWKFGQQQQQQQPSQRQLQKELKNRNEDNNNDVKITINNYLNDEANELSIISAANKSQVNVNENGATISESLNGIASTSDATPVVAGSSVSTQTPILTQSSEIQHNDNTTTTTTTATTTNSINRSSDNSNNNGNQWRLVASQTTQEVRHRMSIASDQLGYSLRQLYASASSITGDVPPSYHNIPGIVPYYHGRSSGPPPSYDDVVNPYAAPPTYQSLFGQMLEARKSSRGLIELLRRLLIISTLGCTMLIAFMILIPFTMIIVGAVYLEDCNIEHIPAFLLVGGLVWASKNIIHCYAQCAAQSNLPDPLAEFATDTNQFGGNNASPTNVDEHANGDRAAYRNNSASGEQLNQNISSNNNSPTNQHPNDEQQQHQQFQQRQREQRFKSSIAESLLNCVLFGWFIAGCVIVFKNYEPDFENTSSPRYCHRTVYMYTFWLITSAITIFGLFVTCICCLMVSSAIATREHDDIS